MINRRQTILWSVSGLTGYLLGFLRPEGAKPAEKERLLRIGSTSWEKSGLPFVWKPGVPDSFQVSGELTAFSPEVLALKPGSQPESDWPNGLIARSMIASGSIPEVYPGFKRTGVKINVAPADKGWNYRTIYFQYLEVP